MGHMASMGRTEIYTGFWLGNQKEGDHLKDVGINGRIVLKLIIQKLDGRAWTGFVCHRLQTDSRLL